MNAVLDTIKGRRSIRKFQSGPVDDEAIEVILSAGQWAPSFLNLQPWKFIVIKDEALKKKLSEAVKLPLLVADYRGTTTYDSLPQVPVVIVVCVDTEKDRIHYVEDGAVATENMVLAAHSLALGSYWIGVFNHGYIEDQIKKILDVPNNFRVISLLPIGFPAESPTSRRKSLNEITHCEKFGGHGFSIT